jgi:nicotinate-nucleotide adenylyltransferase
MLVRDFDLHDEEVIEGVDCHTTARPGMTMIEKMLFIADKIEPNKLKRGGGLQEVYDLRTTDIDAAVIRFLDLRIEEALAGNGQIHPKLIAARNDLLGKRRR